MNKVTNLVSFDLVQELIKTAVPKCHTCGKPASYYWMYNIIYCEDHKSYRDEPAPWARALKNVNKILLGS